MDPDEAVGRCVHCRQVIVLVTRGTVDVAERDVSSVGEGTWVHATGVGLPHVYCHGFGVQRLAATPFDDERPAASVKAVLDGERRVFDAEAVERATASPCAHCGNPIEPRTVHTFDPAHFADGAVVQQGECTVLPLVTDAPYIDSARYVEALRDTDPSEWEQLVRGEWLADAEPAGAHETARTGTQEGRPQPALTNSGGAHGHAAGEHTGTSPDDHHAWWEPRVAPHAGYVMYRELGTRHAVERPAAHFLAQVDRDAFDRVKHDGELHGHSIHGTLPRVTARTVLHELSGRVGTDVGWLVDSFTRGLQGVYAVLDRVARGLVVGGVRRRD